MAEICILDFFVSKKSCPKGPNFVSLFEGKTTLSPHCKNPPSLRGGGGCVDKLWNDPTVVSVRQEMFHAVQVTVDLILGTGKEIVEATRFIWLRKSRKALDIHPKN